MPWNVGEPDSVSPCPQKKAATCTSASVKPNKLSSSLSILAELEPKTAEQAA